MFYLVEECDSKENGIVRYTICSTKEQFEKALDESPMGFADGYEFESAEELREWMQKYIATPKKSA